MLSSQGAGNQSGSEARDEIRATAWNRHGRRGRRLDDARCHLSNGKPALQPKRRGKNLSGRSDLSNGHDNQTGAERRIDVLLRAHEQMWIVDPEGTDGN